MSRQILCCIFATALLLAADSDAGAQGLSIAPNLATPRPAGTAITWTATVSGGTAPFTYRWYVSPDSGGTWNLMQDWSTSATFAWNPSVPGVYLVSAWVRNAGNTSDNRDDGTSYYYQITTPLLQVSLAADRSAPQPATTTIRWTASTSGGTAPYSYKFWVTANNGATWQIVQDWSQTPTFDWIPNQAGNDYFVAVWARSAGNTADAYDDATSRPFPISAAPVGASITVNQPAPQGTGTTITWTASSSGGVSPHSYKWWLSTDNGINWQAMTGWSTSTTYQWAPVNPAPTAVMKVWARGANNNTEAYENTASMPYAVTRGTTQVSLSNDRSSPQSAGSLITWTAVGQGGVPPYSYKWWTSVDGGTNWNQVADWSTNATLTWQPWVPSDNYVVAVWVRSVDNTTDYREDATSALYAINSCSFTLNPPSIDLSSAGGTYSISFTPSSPTCGWAAASTVGWVQVTGSTQGVGSGSTTIFVEPNQGSTPRAAPLLIGSAGVDLDQAWNNNGVNDWTWPPGSSGGSGGGGGACGVTISPAEITLPPGGGAAQVTLNAGTSCNWSIAGNDWLSLSAPNGQGSAVITLTAPVNPQTYARGLLLSVNDSWLAVLQSGSEEGATFYAAQQTPSPSLVASGGVLDCQFTINTGNRNRFLFATMGVYLDDRLIGTVSQNGHQYSLRVMRMYQDRPWARTATCVVRRVPTGEVIRTSSIQIAAVGGPVCVPLLQQSLKIYSYSLRDDLGLVWSAAEKLVVQNLTSRWNSLVARYSAATSVRPFRLETNAGAANLWLIINPSMINTGVWGHYHDGILDINPQALQESFAFRDGIILHELGHARGYGHVSNACPVSDSIMYPEASPIGLYPRDLGPGDDIATERDILGLPN
ncbi:MAG TPA: hypothetical protein VI485_07005 [Vicinamibacterales bacterium]|nr:hypothetical protein [Vicinamibacterales bacterium]